MLGGGPVRGEFTLVSHNGTTSYHTLNTRTLASAVASGMTPAVTLPAEMSLDRLDRYRRDEDWTAEQLHGDNRLLLVILSAGTS